jgi:hypothetical protein
MARSMPSSVVVERLDKIIDRNRAAQRRGLRRLLITLGVMTLLAVIIVLMVTTDLAKPPEPKRDRPTHIDGVFLGTPRTK